MSDLVLVALIAAGGPILALSARPIADAVGDWIQARERRKQKEATAAQEVQDAMVAVMHSRTNLDYGKEVQKATALTLAVLPLAERISDEATRDAVREFVDAAAGKGKDADPEVHLAYELANALLGAIIRR